MKIVEKWASPLSFEISPTQSLDAIYTGCLIWTFISFYLIFLKPFEFHQFPCFFRITIFENNYEKKLWGEEITVLYKYNVNDEKYEISCKKLPYCREKHFWEELQIEWSFYQVIESLDISIKTPAIIGNEQLFCVCFVWRISSKRFLEHVDDNAREKPGLRCGEIRTRARKETRSLLRLPPHDNVTRNYNRRAKWARSRKLMIRGRNTAYFLRPFVRPTARQRKPIELRSWRSRFSQQWEDNWGSA